MANLRSTFINDTEFLRLPNGTTEQRPASPTTGMYRYNTSLGRTEVYTGSTWFSGLGTPQNPASSAQAIYNSNNSAQSGIYYLRRPNTEDIFPVYCKFDSTGGWTNINRFWGPYGEILVGGTRASNGTGFNMIAGVQGDATEPLNGPVGTNGQALTYGCPGSNDRSYIDLTSSGQTMVSDFGFTQLRVACMSVSDDGNVVCGYVGVNLSDVSVYNGTTSNMRQVCNNNPNRWSDLNPERFIMDFSGTFTSPVLFESWTACAGSFRMYVMELFLK